MTLMKTTSFFEQTGKLLLLAVGILFLCQACSKPYSAQGTEEEKEFDLLLRKGKWEKIVKISQERPVESLACQNAVRLAMWHMGMASRQSLDRCLLNSHDVLSSETAALMMSDIYMQLGMVNMARRAAFDAMVSVEGDRLNGRALQRLAEVAIITRQYELARKYLSILEENNFYGKWTREARQMIEHPELFQQSSTYQHLRDIYEKTQDQFFL